MASKDRIELMRDIAESSFVVGTPIASLAELIADELEQQRLRVDGMESVKTPSPGGGSYTSSPW